MSYQSHRLEMKWMSSINARSLAASRIAVNYLRLIPLLVISNMARSKRVMQLLAPFVTMK